MIKVKNCMLFYGTGFTRAMENFSQLIPFRSNKRIVGILFSLNNIYIGI